MIVRILGLEGLISLMRMMEADAGAQEAGGVDDAPVIRPPTTKPH